MFGYRGNTKADEVVTLSKLYKKTKGSLTKKDVDELVKVVYGADPYMQALASVMGSMPKDTKKDESK